MSPRTGRPTDNPKGNSVHVRLDDESAKILDSYCTQENIKRAEGIREGIKLLQNKIKKNDR